MDRAEQNLPDLGVRRSAPRTVDQAVERWCERGLEPGPIQHAAMAKALRGRVWAIPVIVTGPALLVAYLATVLVGHVWPEPWMGLIVTILAVFVTDVGASTRWIQGKYLLGDADARACRTWLEGWLVASRTFNAWALGHRRRQ